MRSIYSVQLHLQIVIQTIEDECENVRMALKSTDSLLFHQSNQPYSFRVHLRQPLYLSGTWTVSLLEFSLDPGKTKQQTFPELFVYSNLCDSSIVGERALPLLRRFYLEKQKTIYQYPYEVPIRLRQFQDVNGMLRMPQLHFFLGR